MKYTTPEMEIVMFKTKDVIVASAPEGPMPPGLEGED